VNLRNALRQMSTIKALLTAAEDEARAMGEQQPGAEHLLLAALDLPDGAARRAFARFGVDADDLRKAIVQVDADALASLGLEPTVAATLAARRPIRPADGRPRIYRSSPSAQEAFQAAAALARAEKPSRFSGAHVVAAVAEQQEGTAARMLEALRIDRRELAEAARRELAERPG
jgi:ATP-dependent Clp protease ATP-binding subunit ClpA